MPSLAAESGQPIDRSRITRSAPSGLRRCHIACKDTSHQAITQQVGGKRYFQVIDEECVGCNLCVNVCPVENCITMVPLAVGAVDRRTGQVVKPNYANWTTHPNNPARVWAAE